MRMLLLRIYQTPDKMTGGRGLGDSDRKGIERHHLNIRRSEVVVDDQIV